MKKWVFWCLFLCSFFAFAEKPKEWKEPKYIKAIINYREKKADLPIGLGHCIAYCESRHKPWARSKVVDGYRSDGLFQIYRKCMYDTQNGRGLIHKFTTMSEKDFVWDNPDHSAELGCNYLAWLIRYWNGSVYLGVLSYTYGFENLKTIKKWEDIPKHCIDYADQVLFLLDNYDESW